MATKLIDYVDIEGSYGGRQIWWGKGSVGNYFGCGVIAALDGFLFHIKETVSRDTYMEMAGELWSYTRPNTGLVFRNPETVMAKHRGIGVYLPSMFRKGLLDFGGNRGWRFEFSQFSNICMPWNREANLNRAVDLVQTALTNGIPVHMLSHRKQLHGLSFHWITITGMEKTAAGHRITVATWGSKRVYDSFEELWLGKGLFQNRFLQFYTVKRQNG